MGGPDFIKAVLGPCPWSRLLPTGGVAATAELCDCDRGSVAQACDNNCDGTIDEGCVFAYDPPVRLDTNATNVSAQGAHSSYHLAASSAGNNYIIVYADARTGGGDIYGRISQDAGSTWQSGGGTARQG